MIRKANKMGFLVMLFLHTLLFNFGTVMQSEAEKKNHMGAERNAIICFTGTSLEYTETPNRGVSQACWPCRRSRKRERAAFDPRGTCRPPYSAQCRHARAGPIRP